MLFQNTKNNPFYSYMCLPYNLRDEEKFYLRPKKKEEFSLCMNYVTAFVADKDDCCKNGIDLLPDTLWKFECDFMNDLEVISDTDFDTDSETNLEVVSDTDNKVIQIFYSDNGVI